MEKIKTFIKKYKSEILIALGALVSIIASISTMSGVNAGICSLVIAVLAVIISILKNGLTDATITLIANAIKIIIEELDKKNTKAVSVSKEEITVDEIKEKLISQLGR